MHANLIQWLQKRCLDMTSSFVAILSFVIYTNMPWPVRYMFCGHMCELHLPDLKKNHTYQSNEGTAFFTLDWSLCNLSTIPFTTNEANSALNPIIKWLLTSALAPLPILLKHPDKKLLYGAVIVDVCLWTETVCQIINERRPAQNVHSFASIAMNRLQV